MKTMMGSEFRAALGAQEVQRNDLAFKCPMCGKIQSMNDFIALGKTQDDAEWQIGFNCIGRQTGAPPAMSEKATAETGCDWTLGGLLKTHMLEVIDAEGRKNPHFDLATPEEAQAHARTHACTVTQVES